METFRCRGYQAGEVARLLIRKFIDNDRYISNLILQKMLFFVQRHSLKQDRSIIFPENFEAWKFGPVVPKVYYDFCHYGSFPLELDPRERLREAPDLESIIDDEFKLWYNKSPFQMVQNTHRPGSAWHLVFDNGRGLRKPIPVSLIYERG